MKCFGLREKRRNYHCKIVLLDQTELIQEIQDVSRGQDVLDVVFKHLDLLETAYFGLRFIDSKGQPFWLDANKNVIKQMKDVNPITLYFNVKFYASDPCKLLEEITRYQFFLQVKQDILQSRLPVSFDLAAELLAYVVQSELGDFDSKRHQNGYISEFKLLPNQTIEFENKAMELHQKLAGQVPATAEMNFLDRVKWLDLYGADLHPVLGEDNVEYFIGLTPSGVIVLRNKSKVGNYFWPRILKIIRNGKYFMLKVVDKNNEEKTYGFELPNKIACKQMWKCCKEHQNFFKLTQNSTQVNSKFGFKNRFRNSGTFSKTVPLNDKYIERPPPTVVRVPSRRYQRRIGQPDGADAGSFEKDETFKENGYIEVKSSILMPTINRHNSTSALYKPHHISRDTQSLIGSSGPYRNTSERGLYSSSTNPSPRSVRSASYITSNYGMKPFLDCNGNSYIDVRRNSSTNISKSRNSQYSDNESEVSKCSHSSRHSRHSHCRHRRQSEDSGTESDSSRKRRHRRKHKYCNGNSNSYKLVDSESQWKDLQRKQQITDQIDGEFPRQTSVLAQSAVVRHVSGYVNSGLESDTETTRHSTLNRTKKKQRSRSKSPEMNRKERIPTEMKKHFEYELVDPISLPENERKDIKYTKIETESRLFKIRYSPSNGRHRYKLQTLPLENGLNSLEKTSKPVEDNYKPTINSYENSYGSLNSFENNHKSHDSTSASVSQNSNSSKIVGSDISGQQFVNSNDNYLDQNQNQTNTQLDYDSYDMYRPTAQSTQHRSTSEFCAYSHFDNYYNEFNRNNEKNQFYFDSYPNDPKTDRFGDDLSHSTQSSAPRVTFQTYPTYYSTDINKQNFGLENNRNKNNNFGNRTNFPLQSHEMITEL